VSLLGYRNDVAELLEMADIFVLPSLYEGFGLAAAEAMWLGRPVIASEVPGIAEVIESGVTGVLVPPADAEALAAAIASLWEDEARRETLGQAAQQVARERFDVSRMTRAYEDLYRRLVKGRHRQGVA